MCVSWVTACVLFPQPLPPTLLRNLLSLPATLLSLPTHLPHRPGSSLPSLATNTVSPSVLRWHLCGSLFAGCPWQWLMSKIVELEEELRVVGNNLKSLEVSEEKISAGQREA
ncbi:uncharacterized protein LOC122373231 isoform X4 [Amphibalanus amphitrite]|uniref:uncharacterized protein LOC122373231 isoform X4 n=1 Tax=Amphibalanus amphitrite TaxID=1232801 RepID=UPI001C91D26A|nr:uncharacterized protein LOC122373231 isoform X4 [Amphibalanus amphitrite]